MYSVLPKNTLKKLLILQLIINMIVIGRNISFIYYETQNILYSILIINLLVICSGITYTYIRYLNKPEPKINDRSYYY